MAEEIILPNIENISENEAKNIRARRIQAERDRKKKEKKIVYGNGDFNPKKDLTGIMANYNR